MRQHLALDRSPSVRSISADGHLHVSRTPISKAAVNPYLGREIPGWDELGLDPDRIYQMYRPPEELERAAATSNGKPLLDEHVHTTAEKSRHGRDRRRYRERMPSLMRRTFTTV